jgi:hypothetical protein
MLPDPLGSQDPLVHHPVVDQDLRPAIEEILCPLAAPRQPAHKGIDGQQGGHQDVTRGHGVSPAFMLFCTALLSTSSRSKGASWPTCRLPVSRSRTRRKP